MVLDRLENIGHYTALGENFAAAAEFIAKMAGGADCPDQVEVDGRKVYAFLSDYQPEPHEVVYEAHARYCDIQCILGGAETMGITAATGTPYEDNMAQRDIALYRDIPGGMVEVPAGWFALFMPGELHAPGHPAPSSPRSRKLVVKVQVK